MAKTLGELKNEDMLHSDDVMERIAEIEDALDADYPRDPDLADKRAKAEAELGILAAFADDAKSSTPVWVVAYETGTQATGGAAGFDWFPNEVIDKAVEAYEALFVGFAPDPVAAYFVEYYPATRYSIDQDVRSVITREIEDEIWAFLPDDRATE